MKLFESVSVLAIGLVGLSYCGKSWAANRVYPDTVPGVRSVLLFPIANDAGTAGDKIAGELTDELKYRINAINAYNAISFSTRLSPIQRALTIDDTLSQQDVTPPITDPSVAQKIGALVGTDGYLLGDIDKLTIDPQTHTVSIVATLSLYVTATSSSAKTVVITGSAAPAGVSESVDSVITRAVDSAAGQLVAGIGSVSDNPNSRLSTPKRPLLSNPAGLLGAIFTGVFGGVILHNTKPSNN